MQPRSATFWSLKSHRAYKDVSGASWTHWAHAVSATCSELSLLLMLAISSESLSCVANRALRSAF